MTAPVPSSRRRFVAGSVVGGVSAFVVLATILVFTAGHADLLRRDLFGNFFDAQARSLLHGHWDVPAKELSIEGFTVDGKTYTYFGVFPSLIRMPILAVADSLSGRLTQLSMLTGFAVLIAAIAALHWRIRQLIRPARPCGRLEPAVVVFGLACGSTIMFLAGRSIVYHEAILWGVAWSLVAYNRILALVGHRSARNLVLACGAATIAFLTRASVGLGPVLALGLVVVGQIVAVFVPRLGAWVRRLDWLGVGETAPARPGRWIAACLVAAVLPVLAYTSVNYSRFGSPAGIPWTKQAFVGLSAQNRRVLAANSNTYFGLQFAPTTALQYLRPDALAPAPLFPFVSFPSTRARVVGDVELIERTVSTSVPASMPALVLLTAVGLVAVVLPRFSRGRGAAALRAPLIGSALAVIPVITVAYVGNRYLGDFLPFLFLGSIGGLQTLLRRREDAPTRRWATVGLGATAVLAVFGVWTNFSLALEYQRLYMPSKPAARSGMLSWQYALDGRLGGAPRAARFVSVLPATPASPGTTAVVGQCRALYWSDGQYWWAVEGTPASGWFRLRVHVPSDLPASWQPLLGLGPAGRQLVVGVHRAAGGAELGLGQVGTDGALHFLPSGTILDRPGTYDVDAVIGGPQQRAALSVDDTVVLDIPLGEPPATTPFTVGTAATPGVAPKFDGRVRLLPSRLGVCRDLLSRRGG